MDSGCRRNDEKKQTPSYRMRIDLLGVDIAHFVTKVVT